jgi:hypothetical protein
MDKGGLKDANLKGTKKWASPIFELQLPLSRKFLAREKRIHAKRS